MTAKRDTVPIEAELEIPQPPNYLRVLPGVTMVPVSTIPEAVLRRLGEAWTEALIRRAAEQRKVKP